MPPIRSARSPATQLSRSSPRGGFPFYRQSCVLYHSLHSPGMHNRIYAFLLDSTALHGSYSMGLGFNSSFSAQSAAPHQNIYILLQSACHMQSLFDFLKVLSKTKFLRQKKRAEKNFFIKSKTKEKTADLQFRKITHIYILKSCSVSETDKFKLDQSFVLNFLTY